METIFLEADVKLYETLNIANLIHELDFNKNEIMVLL
jgi:hypothetical protein